MTRETPLTVGLVQINNDYSGSFYFPYSVGLLQAYAQTKGRPAAGDLFLPPIYRRTPVRQAVSRLRGADVVGFSVYVWNLAISLEIARSLKAANPEVVIVFGGPQVPAQAEAFLRTHAFVDLVCHGEGERAFSSILDHARDRGFDDCPSVSFVAGSGQFVSTPRLPRLKDLSEVPSPYLEGVFAPLIDAAPDEDWLVLWETNRGCPFACTFCDWGSATNSKVHTFEIERLRREADWFAEHRIRYVLCCDANFGIFPRDLEITQYIADRKAASGYPHRFAVFNTKNVTERSYAVQVLLANAGLTTGMSIALQSLDPETLKNSRRDNISLDSFMELQARFTNDGVTPSNDLILGLPGETYESFADGVSSLIE
jgi:radical SAM superfamily enzyme YgiQ (UPF0313 family)